MDEILSLPDRVRKALKDHPDNMDLKLAASGWHKSRQTMAEENTSQALRSLEAFEKRLLALLDALEPETQPTPEATPGEWRWCDAAREFPDPIPAGRGGPTLCSRYMQACGWDAKHSTVDRHIKVGKLPLSCPEGWSHQALNTYARAQFHAKDGTPAKTWTPAAEQPSRDARSGLDFAAQQGSLADAYKAAKIRGQELENELRELKLGFEQGKYVEAATMHEKSMTLAILMYERVKEELLHSVPKIIRSADGDSAQLAPVSRTVQEALDAGMRKASAQEVFQIVFKELKN